MKILNNISEGISLLTKRTAPATKETAESVFLANMAEAKKRVLAAKPKAIAKTRQDIKTWKEALNIANAEEPKMYPLQNLYDQTMDDGLLSSQIENRMTKLYGIDFSLKTAAGEVDEEQTAKLKDSTVWRDITKAILETNYFEYNLIELSMNKTIDNIDYLACETLPRTHIVPQLGKFYPDYTEEDKFIEYRNLKEYGVWVLEFDSKKRGLVNKAVKHVLMKDFAQSCWAELCEIYGIPPRFMKTNTQDQKMLDRAERMMSDMGAASWFIIDETEEFEFAEGVTTSGDVYSKLINLCNNEMSMLVSGAIIGQDTVNGNRSKDESAQEVLWELVIQDMYTVEDHWNRTVLPALKKIGFITGDVKFKYSIPEDLKELWLRVVATLPHFEVDPEWMKTKFGIEITGKKENKATLQFGENLFL